MRNAMAQEFSWAEAGERYAALFQELAQTTVKES
jgi:glycogen synthase